MHRLGAVDGDRRRAAKLVPGDAFGMEGLVGHSFSTSREKITEGMDQ
jgi:hypothetical protein